MEWCCQSRILNFLLSNLWSCFHLLKWRYPICNLLNSLTGSLLNFAHYLKEFNRHSLQKCSIGWTLDTYCRGNELEKWRWSSSSSTLGTSCHRWTFWDREGTHHNSCIAFIFLPRMRSHISIESGEQSLFLSFKKPGWGKNLNYFSEISLVSSHWKES